MDYKTNHTDSLNISIPNNSKAVQNFSMSGDLTRMSYGSFIMPALFGIIGKSLVICIVFKKSCPSSSVPDIFIISLSMVDLLFLLGMPFLIHQLLGDGAWHFGEMMCTVITALDANSQFTSTYILTAMSINHYLATVYPFTSTRFRKPPMAIVVICVLWAFSFLSITPVWLYAQLIPLPGGLLGCGICLPDPRRDIYWYSLSGLPGLCHPFWPYHSGLQEDLAQDVQKLTRTAIAICAAFFVCWAPFHLLQLAQLAMTHPTLPFHYAYNVAISLSYANSFLNPFIYILLGQNFPRQLGVPVRPAAAGQATPKGSKNIHGDASESGQPLRHLVPVSDR
uniref:Melanin-concentrating hormone receptor 1 n=1 Tax=Anser cygnoides TaxID=8845 RepID=A0A8B9DQP7_ANSCY